MAERARAVYYVLDSEGRPIPTATITLRQKGTTTNITETIYAADDPDTSQLTNGAFFSGADGKVEFYLTDPKRLDMLVTKSGYTSQTIPLDVSTISAGYTLVAEEGSNLTARTKLNFIGSGVTATDDAANGRTNVTIAAGGITVAEGGVALDTDITTLDFLGADFNLTESPENEVNVSLAFVGARIKRTGTQSISNTTTTPINFDNEDYDSDGFHDNATNNTRLTVPAGLGGKFSVTAQGSFAAGGTDGRRLVGILLNGVTEVAILDVDRPGTGRWTGTVVWEGSLAATDYVECIVRQESGGALTTSADIHPWMAIHRLGA